MQSKKNNLISAIVITYNEENNIRRCLESIKWVDEIIIVDSYSKDNTVKITKQYTPKIFYKRFQQDFSEQRNFALSKISSISKWVLVLDADEGLSANSQLIVEQLIKTSDIDGYWIPRRNYIDENIYFQYGFFYPDFQLRLFRNKPGIRYKGVIHEELTIPKYKTREVRSVEIYHNYSHSKYNSFLSFKHFFPYIEIEAKYIAKTTKSALNLIFKGLFNLSDCFFQSFIRGKGYKDGYIGFRAAILFSLYRGFTYFFALKYKTTINYAK